VSGILYAATLATALGCGCVAGAFFAFSSFVMPALKRLPPAHGIPAMQSINKLAVTPAFMAAVFGTGAISWGERPVALVLAGGALYFVGVIGVTIARNVPLNQRLAKLHFQDADPTDRWDEYVTKWTAWNRARAAAALAAAATLTIALHAG
jgi:uncharacterized membrane protein